MFLHQNHRHLIMITVLLVQLESELLVWTVISVPVRLGEQGKCNFFLMIP